MGRAWVMPGIALLVLVATTTGGQAAGARAGHCANAVPSTQLSLPAPIVVTTRCGRFRLEADGEIVYKGLRTSPVPRGASYWPEDLVWYRFVRHHLLIGRGLKQLWQSRIGYRATYPANVGRVALGRVGLSFSYYPSLDRAPRLYVARYWERERLVAGGEDPLAFLTGDRLVTWRTRDRALVLRGSDGRFERLVSAHAVDAQWDRRSRLLLFRRGGVLRVFDGRDVRDLTRLGALGVTGLPVVEPLGQLVAVHDRRRLAIVEPTGRMVASAPLPRHGRADGVSSSVVANAAATAVAFTATTRSRGVETVYVLAAGAKRVRPLFGAQVDFKGCGWSSSLAWHAQWLLYSNGDLQAAVVDTTGATAARDLSEAIRRLPGAQRGGVFTIAWAPAP